MTVVDVQGPEIPRLQISRLKWLHVLIWLFRTAPIRINFNDLNPQFAANRISILQLPQWSLFSMQGTFTGDIQK